MQIPRHHRDFARLAVAHADIQCALESFRAISEQKLSAHEPIYRSLLFGAVVSYARPFLGNNLRGKLQGKMVKFKSIEFLEIYNELLNYRNSVVGHSDPEQIKIILIPPGCQFQLQDPGKTIDVDEMMFAVQSPGIHETRIPACIEICNYFEDILINKIFELKDRLFNPNEIPAQPFYLDA